MTGGAVTVGVDAISLGALGVSTATAGVAKVGGLEIDGRLPPSGNSSVGPGSAEASVLEEMG